MSTKTVNNKLDRSLAESFAVEFKVAAFIVLTFAFLNSLLVAYQIGYLDGGAACGYPCVSGHSDYSRDIVRLEIAVALVAMGISLRFRKVLTLCIATLASAFIVIKYLLWYLDSRRWLREIGIADFSKLPQPSDFPHFAGLLRGEPWDLVVLAATTAFLLWQLKVIIGLLTKARRP